MVASSGIYKNKFPYTLKSIFIFIIVISISTRIITLENFVVVILLVVITVGFMIYSTVISAVELNNKIDTQNICLNCNQEIDKDKEKFCVNCGKMTRFYRSVNQNSDGSN